MADEVRIGDEYARRVFVSAKDADWFARLHQQRLIILQIAQASQDCIEGLPVARSSARASVDDQVVRTFGHFRVEIIHQHSQGSLLYPAFATDLGSAWRFDDSWLTHKDCPVSWKHAFIVTTKVVTTKSSQLAHQGHERFDITR